ncbi:MAG: hypothetical protein LC114_22395 [Bryobacterales bacterium]|nr:hypothetical protein [Bryobacterales bacterium]
MTGANQGWSAERALDRLRAQFHGAQVQIEKILQDGIAAGGHVAETVRRVDADLNAAEL